MLLRICLIVAVATTLGALAVSFKVSEKIKVITDERNTYLEQRDQARAAESRAKQDAKEAQMALEEANSQLSETESRLDLAEAEAAEQRKRADDLNSRLLTTTEQRNEAQAELARWRAIGLSVEQVLALRNDLNDALAKIDTLESENGVLSRRVRTLEARINILTVPDYEVKIPAEITGTVTAVDPKYNFVVLNIGRDQDLLENAKLTVARNDDLVGKVQVKSIEQNRSIANILPGWNIEDIREGDRVLTSYEALPKE